MKTWPNVCNRGGSEVTDKDLVTSVCNRAGSEVTPTFFFLPLVSPNFFVPPPCQEDESGGVLHYLKWSFFEENKDTSQGNLTRRSRM